MEKRHMWKKDAIDQLDLQIKRNEKRPRTGRGPGGKSWLIHQKQEIAVKKGGCYWLLSTNSLTGGRGWRPD